MPSGLAREGESATLLKRFLQAYWLRPENAFWMTLRSRVLADHLRKPPAIDLSCGDGVFTFLHLGGVFDERFDVFSATAGLDEVRDRHRDMFDYVDDTYHPVIQKRPDTMLAVGADLKPALLAKAERLSVYERLVRNDNNETLPFEDGEFQTVYCNAAYWAENITGFLSELKRIVQPAGRVILQVKLADVRNYTLEQYRSVLGDRFLDLLGRGRVECWPSLADRVTWESRFAAAGLSVIEETPFVTSTHAHIWDVGLRPIAPLLVKMANALTADTRASIKADWVDLFCDLLAPICNPELRLLPKKGEPAEIQYVLKRA